MHGNWRISRRTFLRGTGVALSLPWLEAMLPATARAAEAVAKPPKRLAVLYVPNGIVHDAWKPTTEGAGYHLPYSLEPLRDLQQHVNVFTGLSQIPYGAREGVGHARPTAALLTGAVASKDGVQAGKSLDQIIAEKIGKQSRLPSLQLSIPGSQLNGACDGEYSCAYSSCISYRDEHSPMPNDNNPRSVYERLFGTDTKPLPPAELSARQALRKSMLDVVREDAQQLHRRLGQSDRRKLDEYLYSVRQIERRVDAAAARSDGVAMMQCPEGRPEDYADHVRLMGDLMVLAFQTDATRVCTLMFGVAAGGQTYPEIGVREGHHDLSHHGNDEEKISKLRKIDRYNVALFAYVLERMQAVPEGEGTLLDNSLVYYGSGLGNANQHTPFDLPVLIAGSAGGAVQPGRHVRSELDTPLNNLWLSVLQAFDISLPRFGNSTGPLPGLLA